MDLLQAMEERHSVRAYSDDKIEGETLAAMTRAVAEVNEQSGLRFQLVTNDEKAFGGAAAHYGKFENVKNYIAVVGKKSPDLHEKAGYYGEKLVLIAQSLGLNTCWVALTYSRAKTVCRVNEGEKLVLVIAIGYGKTQGVPRKSKTPDKVCSSDSPAPEWFYRGVDAALKAPTALNQQKFFFTLKNGTVTAKAGLGFYTKLDLGIAKYHFELASGRKVQ